MASATSGRGVVVDGVITKAPLRGKGTGTNPHAEQNVVLSEV